MRTDYVLRDDSSGALKLCHQAGWNDAYLGIERIDASELARLGKGNLNGESVRALEVLNDKYPEIVTVGTFIYGLPWDTQESVRCLFRGAQRLPLDEIFFIPATPLPGTRAWRPEMWDPTGEFFRSFDFLPRPGPDEFLSRLTAEIGTNYLLCWPWQRVRRMLCGLMARNPRRRRITRHILQRSVPMLSRAALWRSQPFTLGMSYPAWYES